MSILSISKCYNIGISGIRLILQKEGIDTSLNKFKKFDRDIIMNRYLELLGEQKGKIKIYKILSEELKLSYIHISKIVNKKENSLDNL
jgi:hypothetical protein